MTLRITFDLEDKDLKYFREQMKRAQACADRASEHEILTRAREMVREVVNTPVPAFVSQRLEKLSSLIEMLEDKEWALEPRERRNVVNALAYFADPEDLIPDNVPVIGYIDDAIMIELVVKELKPEIDAFEDFCRYRKEEASRNRNPDVSRDEWLDSKRKALHARMRRRRRNSRSTRAPTRTRVRLF